MMKSSLKEYLIISTAIFGFILPVLTAYYFENHPDRIVSQLESTVATIPLGISATEADACIGTQPDTISKERGVLANPTMMLDASNELAPKYGPIQTYSLRNWKRGEVSATIAIDDSGKVAGRWTYVKFKPYNYNQFSLYRVFEKLKNLF